MRRRSKFEQAVDILSNTTKPILISVLLTKANVSWSSTKHLFKYLEVHGFLKKSKPTCLHYGRDVRVKFMYQTTEKGREILKLLNTPPLNELFDYYEQMCKEIDTV